ncbi:MAG: hypothetical protein AABX04_04530 [Nanoarchaeota archaeon]
MVRYRYPTEVKAKDWDYLFKFGLVLALMISAVLLVLNYFFDYTEYALTLFFALPVVWSIIGMMLARKYSSAETRDMHKVSDFNILSLCGYFATFFLTLYALKNHSWWDLFIAAVVFLFFHYYSYLSLRRYLEQKNIPFKWNKIIIMSLLLLVLAVFVAIVQQYFSKFLAVILLLVGISYLFFQYWNKITKQFWYAQRFRVFLVFGFAFNFISLVLWTFILVVSGFLIYYG